MTFNHDATCPIMTRVNRVLASAVAMSDWERDFLRSIARRAILTAKQAAKLEQIEARGAGDVVEPKAAFIEAMEAAGVVPDEPIADKLGPDKIRFRVKGDRKGRRNGWAKYYSDGLPAGSFGSYKLQIAERWHLYDGRELSPEERKRLAEEGRQREQQRAAERDAVHLAIAEQCRVIWDAAGPVDSNHGYLTRKGIAGEGLRQIDDPGLRLLESAGLAMFDQPGSAIRQLAGAVLVPMLDDDGMLWNLQRIRGDGTKLFIKDARTKPLHMLIGEPGDEIAIAEGYGTAAVVRRAVGLPVAVAFSWSNLEHVACYWRERCPEADIIIAADDDAHLVNNPQIQRNLGLDAATAAARAVGGRVAVPPRKAA